jgi:hypothetical protein
MKATLFAAVAALAMTAPAHALTNILVNPGFEAGIAPDAVKAAGSTDITGWTIQRGGVFYAENSWAPFEGKRSVELAGTSGGTIYQDVTLVKGATYKFAYAYSADPAALTGFSVGTVSVNSLNKSLKYTRPAGFGPGNMQYFVDEYEFVATAERARVSFVGGGRLENLVVDTVSLTKIAGVVPEPATWAMLIAGFGMVGVSVRRRRAVASVSA